MSPFGRMIAGSAIPPPLVTWHSYARWPSTWSAKTAPPKAAFGPSVRRPLGMTTICGNFSRSISCVSPDFVAHLLRQIVDVGQQILLQRRLQQPAVDHRRRLQSFEEILAFARRR